MLHRCANDMFRDSEKNVFRNINHGNAKQDLQADKERGSELPEPFYERHRAAWLGIGVSTKLLKRI